MRKHAWNLTKNVTLEHVRLGFVIGIECLFGNLYISFGKYVLIIHKPRPEVNSDLPGEGPEDAGRPDSATV